MSNLLLYKMNLAQKILMAEIDREMKQHIGVSATQAATLLYLDQNNGANLVDLSRELLQHKSAISTLVTRMWKNGLLEKQDSTTDKRATQLFITAKGQRLCTEALAYAQKNNNQLEENFTVEELQVVNIFFDNIISEHKISPSNFFLQEHPKS